MVLILILTHTYAEARYVAHLSGLDYAAWAWLNPSSPRAAAVRPAPQVWRVSCWSAGLAMSRREELAALLTRQRADIRDIPCPHSTERPGGGYQ